MPTPKSTAPATKPKAKKRGAAAAAPKPMSLREELIAAGKARRATDENTAPLDPDVVLASIKSTITRMDDVVDRMSDAVDQAQVQLMISMGATSEQVEATEARLAEKRASSC